LIRKLRLKFVAICMALVTAVLAVVFVSLYVSMRSSVEDLSRQVLYRVAQEDNRDGLLLRPEFGGETLLPYFTVEVWGNRAYVTGGTYADLENTDELEAILNACARQEEDEGELEAFGLRYLRQNAVFYQKMAFVDTSMEREILREMMDPYLTIAAVALVLLLGVSVLLSRWAVRPVEKAWRQQRQFLSDASHELKTPLTVILSNAELLDSAPLEERSARWADNIHSEAVQMKGLVEEMLTLARADNMVRPPEQTAVSLSDIVTGAVLAFEPVAFEAGKPLESHIQENLTVTGEAEKLRRLVSILLDNAVKYGAAGGIITLTLERADRQARLVVSNPGDPIPAEHLPHLFERFYRSDASRGEKSGFGLGLSIADSIVREHRGTVRAESDSVSTRFTVTIPLKKQTETSKS